MASTAANLLDHVLPVVPYRQHVLTLPRPLPQLLAWCPDLLERLLSVLARSVERDLRRRTCEPTGRTGMVSFIQNFTGDLRCFLHIHAVVTDGVWVEDPLHERGIRFVPAPIPSPQDIQALTEDIATGIARTCRRWRRALDEDRQARLANHTLEQLASLDEELVTGPRPSRRRPSSRDRRWIGEHLGAQLHVGVTVDAHDTRGREALCRYAARPALSLQRIALEEDGRVLIRFKNTWKNGATGVRLQPEVFILRLAALVMPERINLTRFHGVFAPASPWRNRVVPLHAPEDAVQRKKRRWFPWAQLIYRAFGTQPDACPHCGERMGVQAFLLGGGRAEHVLQWVEAHGHRLRDGPYGTQAVAA